MPPTTTLLRRGTVYGEAYRRPPDRQGPGGDEDGPYRADGDGEDNDGDGQPDEANDGALQGRQAAGGHPLSRPEHDRPPADRLRGDRPGPAVPQREDRRLHPDVGAGRR